MLRHTDLFRFLGVASSVSLLSSSDDESSLRLEGVVGDASPPSPSFFVSSASLPESESIRFFAKNRRVL